ncbi:GIY-YIG nuclease family protein [Ekhidna sp.]|uniref:GIY-YIG nuclease family protein n=1 Tax=Ekhidna sp. TaxID=2608089 RepID=UPI003517EAE0
MPAKGGYVYIITNKHKTVLYTGVTSNLYARIHEHKEGLGSAWASKYKCKYLVYFEFHDHIETAIKREKQIKKWKREYKENLINEFNKDWMDLFDQVEDMQ